MAKCFTLTIILLLNYCILKAWVLPGEGSKLNYTLVGFSIPKQPGVNEFRIEIAVGNYNSKDSFERNITINTSGKTNKIITKVPYFGKQYTWRAVYKSKNLTDPNNGKLHHFSTLFIPAVDTNLNRLRVLKDAERLEDAYVFLDGNRVLYDMKGEPVWFLPDIDGFITERSQLRDLKLTNRGTITFIYEERGAYEINYNGDILWKAPNNGAVSNQKKEFYHHEFTRLSTGHYMILGCEYELYNQKTPFMADSNEVVFNNDNLKHYSSEIKPDSIRQKYKDIPFGTVIEYDEKGKVVWSWKSSGYFKSTDKHYHVTGIRKQEIAPHANSFFFDERAGVIYIGFRNISRIIKLRYPDGIVLNDYYGNYKAGRNEESNSLFCRQHSVRLSDKGYLYLFNNNSCSGSSSLPAIIRLKEDTAGEGGLKKIWEYTCTIDGTTEQLQGINKFPVGGNAIELPGNFLFANMSSSYSKVFILDSSDRVIWSAIPEKWNTLDKKWQMAYQYRASIIANHSEMEKLVWSGK